MPDKRKRGPGRLAALAVAVLLAGKLASPSEAGALNVTIDTSAFAAGTPAELDFALFDGDLTMPNNTVTISNLATDGTLGTTTCALGCTAGGSPPSFGLDDSLGLAQFVQELLLGSTITFHLEFTTNFSGLNVPDRLTLNLLDPGTSLTLVDTDLDFLDDPIPGQDLLLLVDLQGNGETKVPTQTNPVTPVTVVPEPGSLALLALGLPMLAACRRRIVRERPSYARPFD